MATFLQLIRFPNLVMIALTQFLFYFFWIPSLDYSYISIDLFNNVVIATILIAIGGNIINDIFDVQTDRINKPHKQFIGSYISKKNAYFLYFVCTFVGIGLGSYVGFTMDRWWISLIFAAIAVLLFLYSSHLKGIPVLGNIVVSLLVASSILILIAFDNGYVAQGKPINFFNKVSISAIYVYASFAFLINLIREMVKDIEDVNGDYNAGINTLPIILGRNRVNKIVAILAGILICLILFITSKYLQGKTITTVYILITILLPLLYFIIKIWQADTEYEYRMLSLLLKLIMLFGILSTLVFYYFDPIDKLAFLLP